MNTYRSLNRRYQHRHSSRIITHHQDAVTLAMVHQDQEAVPAVTKEAQTVMQQVMEMTLTNKTSNFYNSI